MKVNLNDNINSLNLNKDIINKLYIHKVYLIKELWQTTRSELRTFELTNKDISEVVIRLQLLGLDLNKKLY